MSAKNMIAVVLMVLVSSEVWSITNWQPGHLWHQQYQLHTRFGAKPVVSPEQQQDREKIQPDLFSHDYPLPLNDNLEITGRPGQILIVCAKEISTSGTVFRINSNRYAVELTDFQISLWAAEPSPCQKGIQSERPYHYRQFINSGERFLVSQHEKKEKPSQPLPYSASSGFFINHASGYGGGSQDDQYPKHPPSMPFFTGGVEFSIGLLFAILAKTTLAEDSDTEGFLSDSNMAITLRFGNNPPERLWLTQWEFQEMAEYLTSTGDLLRWLAGRFGERISFIHSLLTFSSDMSETAPLETETGETIKEQLSRVLEQENSEFYLDFELHLLGNTLALSSAPVPMPPGMLEIPTGVKETVDNPAPEGDQAAAHKPTAHNQESNKNSHGKRAGSNDDEDNDAPLPPTHSGQVRDSTTPPTGDDFLIELNRREFLVSKQQLDEKKRGQEPAGTINAREKENPDNLQPLDQLEVLTGINQQDRLSGEESKALDYLVKYGTEKTLKELPSYYPVKVIGYYQQGNTPPLKEVTGRSLCSSCEHLLLSKPETIKTKCGHYVHSSCLNKIPFDGEPQIAIPLSMQRVWERLRNAKIQGAGSTPSIKKVGIAGTLVKIYDPMIDEVQSYSSNRLCPECNNPLSVNMMALADKKGQLIKAIQNNDTNEFKIALASARDDSSADELRNLLYKSPTDCSLLHHAVWYNRLEMVEQLLKQANNDGTILHSLVNSQGDTPLHIAAFFGHYELVEKLLTYGHSTAVVNKSQQSPIYLACRNGRTNIVALLMENVYCTVTSEELELLLEAAAAHGHHITCDLLIRHGAKINTKTLEGPSVQGMIHVINLLIAHGATPTENMIMKALNKKQFPAARTLLDVAVERNLWPQFERFPLLVTKSGHTKLVQFLLDNGVDINQKFDGISLLMVAYQHYHTDTITKLLEHGGRVDDKQTSTDAIGLMVAAYQNRLE